jgi:hypothetical protein
VAIIIGQRPWDSQPKKLDAIFDMKASYLLVKNVRTFISLYYLFTSKNSGANIKLNLHKAFVISIMDSG